MGTKKRSPEDRPDIVRRSRDERKRLPAELEAFAQGDDDALWRRKSSRRLDDPRPVGTTLVPGVANRDARLVFDARVKRLRAAVAAQDEDRLAEELAEAVHLALWRANAVVGFDVFAEAVLAIDPTRARELVKRGATALGLDPNPADETRIALWMRAESGLLETAPDATARLRNGRLILDMPFERAAEALSGTGRRAAPMAKMPTSPEVVVDRPKGVMPLRKVIERDRPRDE